MATPRGKDNWMYFNVLRGTMAPGRMLEGALLVAETKAQNKNEVMKKETAYEAMLVVADKLRVQNPFPDPDAFYQVYTSLSDTPDWEEMLHQYLSLDGMYTTLVPAPLMEEMTSYIDGGQTVLIAEGEKFVPYLRSTVDAHLDKDFTITSQNLLCEKMIERIFDGYTNVKVVAANIYKYGFLNEQFDRILSVPAFAGRDLAEDASNFMCRETDMVALENLLLHRRVRFEVVRSLHLFERALFLFIERFRHIDTDVDE